MMSKNILAVTIIVFSIFLSACSTNSEDTSRIEAFYDELENIQTAYDWNNARDSMKEALCTSFSDKLIDAYPRFSIKYCYECINLVYEENDVTEDIYDVVTTCAVLSNKQEVQYMEVSVSAKNWDADADKDGFEINYRPLDDNDKVVATNGEMYYILYEENGRGVLDNRENKTVKVTPENCDFYDCTVKMSSSYALRQPDYYAKVKVVFITEDGKEFSALDDFVSMG